MAELPKLPLWTDAYLGDTGHLTTIEHGAYLLLLITAWRSKDGLLPDDDKMLARYTRLTLDKWRKMRPIIEPFFSVEKGVWKQGRLLDERDAAIAFSKRQSENGSSGGAGKHLKRKNRHIPRGKAKSKPEIPPHSQSHSQFKPPNPLEEVEAVPKGFDILVLLDEKKLNLAKEAAPGWDIYHLASIYNESVKDRGMPKYPAAAFRGWLKSYTKGRAL